MMSQINEYFITNLNERRELISNQNIAQKPGNFAIRVHRHNNEIKRYTDEHWVDEHWEDEHWVDEHWVDEHWVGEHWVDEHWVDEHWVDEHWEDE